MNYNKLFSKQTLNMRSSIIREMLSSTKGIPGLISFAGGFPAPETFPKEDIAQIFADVIKNEGDDILQYGASEGDRLLKEQLRRVETDLEGLKDEEILVTVGSTNGIYLYAASLVNEGDVILAEAPSFLGSLLAFESMGADLVSIDMDDEGIIPEKMSEVAEQLKKEGKNIKFLYLIPDFQNPRGTTMSHKRRKEIIEVASEYNIPILEDNPYGPLRYAGEKVKSMYSIARYEMGNPDTVTMVKSFSKILGPGLRLAYIIGSEILIGKMCSWMQKVNVSPDCVAQRAVAEYLKRDLLMPHVETVRDFYRPRMNAMIDSMNKFMPDGLKWTKPDGGMFLWIELPEKINGDELFEKAKKFKIAFIPGSNFYPKGREKYNCMRLNFSYPTPEQIETGIERLAELIKSEM